MPTPGGRVAQMISKAKDYTRVREQRRETLATAGKRDNSWFLYGLAGITIVPPAIILAIASTTGILERLQNGYRY